MIRLHLRSVVDLIGLARDILTIPARRTDDLIERALADADGLAAHLLDCPRDPIADYAAQVADLTPPTVADWDLPPMRRHGDIAKALAELDAVESVDDLKWLWAWDAHPSNGGEAA